MTVARLVARCVHGLEELLADEIGRGGWEVGAVGHREVRFAGRAGPGVLGLRTADDVFVPVADVDGGRDQLGRLRRAVGAADLDGPLLLRERCGGPPTGPTLDVSASFLGRRSYSRYDLEDAVGEVLARRLGRRYHSRRDGARAPDGGLAWRLTVVDDRAALALRIAGRPLHRRPYKVASVPGTLHPPVAAAMVALAGPGSTLLDPCCGAGTIPVEVARAAPGTFLGTDADPAALAAAARNGRNAPVVRWAMADAAALPLTDSCVDRVVVNPPWERQVHRRGLLAARPAQLWCEIRRVLGSDGQVVALLHRPESDLVGAAAAGLTVERELPVSLFGTHPVIVRMRCR
jgi:tRNA (guanine6-N2)-methyltransferase